MADSLRSVELLQLLSPSIPTPAKELIEAVYGFPIGQQTPYQYNEFKKLVKSIQKRGWKIILIRGQGYVIDLDHLHILSQAIGIVGMRPRWTVLPGPCELLQVMENLMFETGRTHI